MIIGVGTDMVDSRRIEQSLRRFGMRFQNRILGKGEHRALDERELAAYLSRQFAAKEAVAKALGTGMRQGVNFRSIRIYRNEQGAPFVSLVDAAEDIASRLGVTEAHISISDERHYALAFAVVVKTQGSSE